MYVYDFIKTIVVSVFFNLQNINSRLLSRFKRKMQLQNKLIASAHVYKAQHKFFTVRRKQKKTNELREAHAHHEPHDINFM